jgi:hypothetical protein
VKQLFARPFSPIRHPCSRQSLWKRRDKFFADFAGETRTLEGVLVKNKITDNDFPLQPWHTYYDWNFHVRVDPQFTYLNSPTSIDLNRESFTVVGVLPKNYRSIHGYGMAPNIGTY